MLYYLILSVTLGAFLPTLSAQNCAVDSFQTQANFDINRYKGKWFEIYWAPPYFEDSSYFYVDYVENYTPATPGLVNVTTAGRADTPGSSCSVKQKVYEYGSNPAKMSYIAVASPNQTINMSYWVMDTDYDIYSFVYGCTLKFPNGTCSSSHAWVWSRTQTLSETVLQNIREQDLPKVCMQWNDTFVSTAQTQDCLPVSGSTEIFEVTKRCISIVSLVALSLLLTQY